MVYIDGVKYACAACIKGHRSSSCAHTSRPLFEIKKKGRPVTQCAHCRQLRKTRQVHVKCSCGAGDGDGGGDGGEGGSTDSDDPRGKGKRKMPAAAVFPDGLAASSASLSAPSRQRRPPKPDAPCPCGSAADCRCATPVSKRRAPSSSASSGPATPPPAAFPRASGSGRPKPARLPDVPYRAPYTPDGPASLTPRALDYAPAPPPPPAPDLAWPPGGSFGLCSCGATCTCPGCLEHSDPATALTAQENCPYSCSACVHCNAFAPAPDPAAWAGLPAWPAPDPAPAPGDCCGGACQCTVAAAECRCAPGCCGCCAGCVCAPDGPRVGFAVSGERGSCRGECRADNAPPAPESKRRRLEYDAAAASAAGTPRVQSPSSQVLARTLALFPFTPPGAEVDRWEFQ